VLHSDRDDTVACQVAGQESGGLSIAGAAMAVNSNWERPAFGCRRSIPVGTCIDFTTQISEDWPSTAVGSTGYQTSTGLSSKCRVRTPTAQGPLAKNRSSPRGTGPLVVVVTAGVVATGTVVVGATVGVAAGVAVVVA
jgi:hypothetical protein